MAQPTGTFIDGQHRTSSGERFSLTNPATEERFLELASSTPEDVDRAAKGAQRAFEQTWRDITPGRRAEILYKIARLIREHQDELARLDMESVGKPIAGAR